MKIKMPKLTIEDVVKLTKKRGRKPGTKLSKATKMKIGKGVHAHAIERNGGKVKTKKPSKRGRKPHVLEKTEIKEGLKALRQARKVERELFKKYGKYLPTKKVVMTVVDMSEKDIVKHVKVKKVTPAPAPTPKPDPVFSYCLQCKKQVELLNPTPSKNKSGTDVLVGHCSECNGKLTRFIKKVRFI